MPVQGIGVEMDPTMANSFTCVLKPTCLYAVQYELLGIVEFAVNRRVQPVENFLIYKPKI